MANWQPIETAPLGENTDYGPGILIWTGISMYVAQHAWDDPDGTHVFFDGDIGHRNATHWQPLPEPPNA